jgi:diguanylate cyclase (GGDEF)-like protein
MTAGQRPVGPESFAGLTRRLDKAAVQPSRGGTALFENLLAGQQEVVDLVLGGAQLDEVLGRLALILGRVFAPSRCGISVFDARGHLCHHAAPHLSTELGPESEPAKTGPAGPVEAALVQRARTVVADFQVDSRWPIYGARALVQGLRACWAEPVGPCGEEFAAVVALFHFEPGTPNARDEEALEVVASLVAFAIAATQRQQAVHLANERFASVTAAVPGVVYQRLVTADEQIRYTYISEGARDLFGVAPDEILSNPDALFSRHAADYSAKFRERLLAASKALNMWDVEATIVTPDGRKKYTHAIARPERRADGSVLWTGIILDETRTREALVESLSEGFLLFDSDDRLIIKNSHFIDLYPTLIDIAVPGASYEDIVRAEFANTLGLTPDDVDAAPEFRRRLEQHGHARSMSEHHLKDDRWVLVNEHRTSEGGTVVHYTDITELKRREQQIQHLAFHDALTGLPNRLLFQERIVEALADAKLRGETIAVLCLDLDHFKNVNDSLGHPAGDALLKVVGDRLRQCVRERDTVARLGGDEFGVVLARLTDAELAATLASRMISALNEPADLSGHQAVIGTSIGVSTSAAEGLDADKLLKNADLALYRAKADGRGTFRFFEADMDARAQARRALEINLRQATARGELELHYQPQVHLQTRTVTGFEALVRWRHPERGLVSPGEFIPLAEETGIIIQIGEWVLRQACSDATTWPDGINVAVNVSPAQFRDHDLAQRVAKILAETGLPAHRLEIEITESLLLRDVKANLGTLDELRQLGLRISMDDFGTGYSSLSNLRSFPFDKIKIDRSFVKDLDESPDSAAIVRAVLGLGLSLGISTCAEGVETAAQMAALREQGCTEMQGYYFSPPRPLKELANLLTDHGGAQRRG